MDMLIRFITTRNLTVNLDAKTVDVCGSRLDLTRQEYEVMQLLAMYKGATLSKEMFMDHLYGGTNARKHKLIAVFIRKLRKKLAVGVMASITSELSGAKARHCAIRADTQEPHLPSSPKRMNWECLRGQLLPRRTLETSALRLEAVIPIA
jgi:hypothetical protein